ncbi:MotA/TolQ/ExbB proton channel family protein [Thaumasiovibrio subtropicus]|uniref:MotA/TolQ/ExbB proton channel family protein n=1 Tax=Thaumasiovibrio subtropicus TaxID=1891207 RepID=UPI000B35324D|nr:MotA/TolQ/ExbB proton channel family protein [Thaumasiovibrio subtropicus]
MSIFSTIQSQLGVMSWPLIALSVITLTIIIERLVYIVLNSRFHGRAILSALYELDVADQQQLADFAQAHGSQRSPLSRGVSMLFNHRHFPKQLREEAVSIWLHTQRQRFVSGLRVLNIIGVISPLIGLLGTVLGLIGMFEGIAQTTGSVTPSDLADGLGLAMATTAAGLIIALPSITCSQLFSVWADKVIAKIEYTLNHCNLYLEGVSIDKPHCPKPCEEHCDKEEKCCA